MIPKTIFDAYTDFQLANIKVNKSTLRSVIHRFLAKHWGGEAPIGAKASNEEVFKLIELLKELPATLLVGSMDILEKEFMSKGVAKENSKSYRSAYKVFFNWAQTNNYCLEFKEEDIHLKIKTNIFTRKKNGTGEEQITSYHNKTSKQTYILMGKYSGSSKSCGQLIYPSDYINNNLMNEINLFERFRRENHNCSKATINKNIVTIYQFLGWIHRYKNISLEDLSLNLIVIHIKLNISSSGFKDEKGKINYQDYMQEKAMLRQEALEIANENKKTIEEYLAFVGGHPSTKALIVGNCISVAKFIFRNEIGTDDYADDADLPIIRRLNQLSAVFNKQSKSAAPSVSHSSKSIPWHETFEILERLRKRIHYVKYERIVTRKNKQGSKQCVRTSLRNEAPIINNLQTFLSLAFMILIPVDRSRTYYQLELGRTFVCGLYKDDRFISLEKLEDKTRGTWYIHLQPSDYKTGKIYKEYWGIMPNVQFDRDNDLYSYIERWINKGRNYEQNCNHNYFFRQKKDYKPLNSTAWCGRIRTIFAQETGIPVTPKELRKMFITYLYNEGATDAELKGAAYAQHHSQKIQGSIYNSQTIMDRIQPIYDLNERMHEEFFDSSDEEEEEE